MCIMASVQDLGKCSASRGHFLSYVILCLDVSQTFEELEAKQSVMLQRHTYFYIDNWGMRFDDQTFCISVMAGLIVEILFMLLSVYNAE